MLDEIIYLNVLLAVTAGLLSVRLLFALFHLLRATREIAFDTQCGVLGATSGLFIGLCLAWLPEKPVPELIVAAVPVAFIATPVLVAILICSCNLYHALIQRLLDL